MDNVIDINQEQVRKSLNGVLAQHPVFVIEDEVIHTDGKLKWKGEGAEKVTLLPADPEILAQLGYQLGVMTPQGIKWDAATEEAHPTLTTVPKAVLKRLHARVRHLLPEDGTLIPFIIEPGMHDIPQLIKAMTQFSSTEAGDGPMLGNILLVAGQRKFPESAGEKYNDLEEAVNFVRGDTDVMRFRCFGTSNQQEIDEIANRKVLPSQRNLATALGMYYEHFDTVPDWKDVSISTGISAVAGVAGAAIMEAVPGVAQHLPNPISPVTDRPNLIGAGQGTGITTADWLDNTGGFFPKIRRAVQNGKSWAEAIATYGGIAAKGAASGEAVNIGAGEIYSHGGDIGAEIGTSAGSWGSSLGFAADSKQQRKSNIAVNKAAEDAGRSLPSDAVLELEQAIKTAPGEDRRNLQQQREVEQSKSNKALGKAESTADMGNRRQEEALILTPLLPLVRWRLIREGLMPGTEVDGLAAINLVVMAAVKLRHSGVDKTAIRVASGEEVSIMELAHPWHSAVTHNFAYNSGHVAEVSGHAFNAVRALAHKVRTEVTQIPTEIAAAPMAFYDIDPVVLKRYVEEMSRDVEEKRNIKQEDTGEPSHFSETVETAATAAVTGNSGWGTSNVPPFDPTIPHVIIPDEPNRGGGGRGGGSGRR